MSRSIAGALALASFAASVALPAHAQAPPAAERAEAGTAFDAALALDPDIAGAQAELRAAEIRARTVGLLFEGAPSATLNWQSDKGGAGLGYREYEAEVSAPLFLPGERGAARRAASAQLDAARAQLDLARLDLAARLRAAWAERGRAEGAARIARRLAEDSVQLVAATRRLAGAGEQSQLDLVQVEALQAQAEAESARTDAAFVAADAQWRALIGASAAAFVDARPIDGAGLDDHPLLRLRRAEEAFGTASARRASLGGFPSPEIGLLARREREARGLDDLESFGFMVRLPLGRDPGTRAATAEARAVEIRARAASGQDRRALEAGILASRARLAAAERSLSGARTRVDRLTQALTFTERGRREGALGFIEYLRARSALAEAELALSDATVDRATAEGDLAQALGIAP